VAAEDAERFPLPFVAEDGFKGCGKDGAHDEDGGCIEEKGKMSDTNV
jgi:hypothetical protein